MLRACVGVYRGMFSSGREDISGWAARIDTIIGNTAHCCVRRVVVLQSTPSTQDAALAFARGEPGLLVVASQQTRGRGSHARAWRDGDRRTLPCTFVIEPCGCDAPMLAACVACAVNEALSSLVPSGYELKIKWPNDIVVRGAGRERKLAGILIERKMGLTLVGVGINCTQEEHDWDDSIRDTAVSLRELGAHTHRLELVCRLIEHLSQWLFACDRHAIRAYYQMHDAMSGTRRAFTHNRAAYRGLVEHVDPLECIVVETDAGRCMLPVAQTSCLKE